MKQLTGEHTLVQHPGVVLTTHRVRSTSQNPESKKVTSIMLDQLASCGVETRSRTLFLVLAAVCFLFGIFGGSFDSGSVAGVGFLLAVAFVAVYFSTREQVLSLASAGDAIRIQVQGLTVHDVIGFIDAVEEAKNARYLLRSGI